MQIIRDAAYRHPFGTYRFVRELYNQYTQGQIIASNLPYTTADTKHTPRQPYITYRQADLYQQKQYAAQEFGFPPPPRPGRRRGALGLYNSSQRRNTVAHRGIANSSKMSRRRNFKRRRFAGKNPSFTAKLALSKIRKLERKQEKKFHEIALTTIVDVSDIGVVTPLCLIAAGSGIVNRDGNVVAPLFLLMTFRWIGVAAATSEIYRTIIFKDRKQVASTTPTVLEVLRLAHPLSLFATENIGRFQILYDQCFTGPGDASVLQSYAVKLRIKTYGTMGFINNLATSISENGIYMLSVTNQTVVGGTEPSVNFTSRLVFTDS